MTSVGDMEKAEKDNMLQMSFNITNSLTSNGVQNDYQIQMQTGLLSQSYVKYNIYSNHQDGVLCYTGYVHGADDETGWYELAARMGVLVAARRRLP